MMSILPTLTSALLILGLIGLGVWPLEKEKVNCPACPSKANSSLSHSFVYSYGRGSDIA